MALSTDDLARTIREPLTIARVAMPSELYDVDPRVIKAEALLARLEGRLQ
jgi:hypothetical protein